MATGLSSIISEIRENPRKWTAFKERQGINYIKDFDAKEREIEILRLDVVNWLSAGNSPYDEETADSFPN